jgi:hypothetical protein
MTNRWTRRMMKRKKTTALGLRNVAKIQARKI